MDLPALPDWMARVDDLRRLSELTIPGTHDSGGLRGRLRPKTQTLDIPSQLRAGIRFLDIRLRDDAGVLRLFHGKVDEHAEFEADALAPTLAFLDEHAAETVIVSVKQEGGDDAGFARDFERVVARHAAAFHVTPEIPRLGEVRGRVVLLRRYAAGGLGIPAPPELWQNNATFRITAPPDTLEIEDMWDLAHTLPWRLDGKWTAVARHLDAAATQTGWYLTFTSATSDFSFPRWIAAGLPVADGINRRLLDYAERHPGQRLGTVVMDFPEFPDGRLIATLAGANR
ncbi:MAG: phosphatidylinositol-specific phospholipase C [Solirubrobacteraceae bacterium]